MTSPLTIESILFQAGMVGAFIAYTIYIVNKFLATLDNREKQHMETLAQRDTQYLGAMRDITTQLGCMEKAITGMADRLEAVEDVVKPPRKSKGS